MFEIIPGILEKEWSEIERKIEIVKPFVKTIHIDIIDGKFAPNTTFLDPTPFANYTKDITFELHMMVENPIQYLKPFANVGFRRFLGHVEKMPDQEEFVAQGQLLGGVGLAIDGPTSLDVIKVPYRDLDSILVMTIKAGESGQMFNPEYLKKVEILRKAQAFGSEAQARRDDTVIEIDGGVNDKTIVQACNAGANRYVANSFLFKTNNAYNQYQVLEQSIKQLKASEKE